MANPLTRGFVNALTGKAAHRRGEDLDDRRETWLSRRTFGRGSAHGHRPLAVRCGEADRGPPRGRSRETSAER
jgi:hypothetical protein